MISFRKIKIFIVFYFIISSTCFAEVPRCYQGELNIFLGPQSPYFNILYDHLLTNGQSLSKNEFPGLHNVLQLAPTQETFEIPDLTTTFSTISPKFLLLTICTSGVYPDTEAPNYHFTPEAPKNSQGWRPGFNVR